jgi:four helix bundle protein
MVGEEPRDDIEDSMDEGRPLASLARTRDRKSEGEEPRDDGRKMKEERAITAKRITSVRDLEVYKEAFDAAMRIFEISKGFPKEEMCSLTDQIRRSSRSVCSNLAEGWRKRLYRAVFLDKLADAGQEACETQTWLEFAYTCTYLDERVFLTLDERYEHIFAMLNVMEKKVDAFCRQ